MNTILINSRQYTAALPLPDELSFATQKNYLFDLSYLISIVIDGESGSNFLQGQLSCDLQQVTTNQMQPGALCNLKGRVLALMEVIYSQTQGLSLVLPRDLADDTMSSLAKAAQFSRVQLHPAHDLVMLGFLLNHTDDITPFKCPLPEEPFAVISYDDYLCYHLGNHRYVFITTKGLAEKIIPLFQAQQQWRGSLAWHQLALTQHYPEIYPNTRGLLLPHRIGLQKLGYLNFQKGCYKGQEIIARTHFKAKLKHEVALFRVTTSDVLQSGLKLYQPGSAIEIGELIDLCPLNTGDTLIMASILFDHPNEIQIESMKQPVTLHPYTATHTG